MEHQIKTMGKFDWEELERIFIYFFFSVIEQERLSIWEIEPLILQNITNLRFLIPKRHQNSGQPKSIVFRKGQLDKQETPPLPKKSAEKKSLRFTRKNKIEKKYNKNQCQCFWPDIQQSCITE